MKAGISSGDCRLSESDQKVHFIRVALLFLNLAFESLCNRCNLGESVTRNIVEMIPDTRNVVKQDAFNANFSVTRLRCVQPSVSEWTRVKF